MKFKSKIDWWVYIVFWGFIALTVWTTWGLLSGEKTSEGWMSVVISWGCTFGLIIPLFTKTYYLLGDEELFISCWIIKIHIPYGNILSVKETNNPLSSPALSLDRIRIEYNTKPAGKRSVMISPEDKQEFIHLLERKRRLQINRDLTE